MIEVAKHFLFACGMAMLAASLVVLGEAFIYGIYFVGEYLSHFDYPPPVMAGIFVPLIVAIAVFLIALIQEFSQ